MAGPQQLSKDSLVVLTLSENVCKRRIKYKRNLKRTVRFDEKLSIYKPI